MRTSSLELPQSVHQKLVWAADLIDLTPEQLVSLMVEHYITDESFVEEVMKHQTKEATP